MNVFHISREDSCSFIVLFLFLWMLVHRGLYVGNGKGKIFLVSRDEQAFLPLFF